MMSPMERRKVWSRTIGIERRCAPFHDLAGRALPDPTRLEDEEFIEAQARMDEEKRKASGHAKHWDDPTRFD